MDWQDDGILLSARPHGETAAIVEVFTRSHGRHAGVVRGGQSRRLRGVLQPGTEVQAAWHARLGEHLGAFVIEPRASRAGLWDDRVALAGLGAVTGLLSATLPERAPHPALHAATLTVLDAMALPRWASVYLRWEVGLLAELGFALDLTCCAVTGAVAGLAFVSPRTGRAVARAAAAGWEDRLLPLPACLGGDGPAGPDDLSRAFALTGHFLSREALHGGALPAARGRLVAMLAGTDGRMSPFAQPDGPARG
jgi:DNA repair protein RecO (recombination protein O)